MFREVPKENGWGTLNCPLEKKKNNFAIEASEKIFEVFLLTQVGKIGKNVPKSKIFQLKDTDFPTEANAQTFGEGFRIPEYVPRNVQQNTTTILKTFNLIIQSIVR